jgi:hypothetical protein
MRRQKLVDALTGAVTYVPLPPEVIGKTSESYQFTDCADYQFLPASYDTSLNSDMYPDEVLELIPRPFAKPYIGNVHAPVFVDTKSNPRRSLRRGEVKSEILNNSGIEEEDNNESAEELNTSADNLLLSAKPPTKTSKISSTSMNVPASLHIRAMGTSVPVKPSQGISENTRKEHIPRKLNVLNTIINVLEWIPGEFNFILFCN